MTIATVALPRVVAAPRAAVRRLAWIEGVRVLRHPAPWIGLAAVRRVGDQRVRPDLGVPPATRGC